MPFRLCMDIGYSKMLCWVWRDVATAVDTQANLIWIMRIIIVRSADQRWIGRTVKTMKLIDLDIFFKEFNNPTPGKMCHELAEECVVDAVPVVHGHWVFHEERYCPPVCSVCKSQIKTPGYCGKDEFYISNYKFCPNCGATMDEKDSEYRDE